MSHFLHIRVKRAVFLLVLFLNISHAWTQLVPHSIITGLGATYAVESETPGINIRTYYAADHHFCLGPEISVFHPVEHNDVESELFEANLNVHYIFELPHHWGIYPFGGLNYSVEKERDIVHNDGHDITAIGANVGAGLHYTHGSLLFFAEYKYVVSDLSDHLPTLGALYNFQIAKHHASHITH